MPFDSTNYQPTDEVLATLEGGRALVAAAWWQMNNGRPEGAHCIITGAGEAWRRVSGDNHFGDDHEAYPYLLRAAGVGSIRALGDLNDAPSTTHDDVLALFDRAIAARVAEQAKVPA